MLFALYGNSEFTLLNIFAETSCFIEIKFHPVSKFHLSSVYL